MLEKADLSKVKQIVCEIKEGKITVSTVFRSEKPTPLAYHILAQYGDISELMAPEHTILSNIDKMKNAIEARTATLLCMNCASWTSRVKVKDLPEKPICEKCGSGLLALLYHGQDENRIRDLLSKRLEGKQFVPEELKELAQARRKAAIRIPRQRRGNRAGGG
jgi:hypothetical protein